MTNLIASNNNRNFFFLSLLLFLPLTITIAKQQQEANSKITRFILICNYVTRIIEPLASRCAKFRFQPLPPASMKSRLTEIAMAENCDPAVVVPQLLDDIMKHAHGDMRRAVTTLQSVHSTGMMMAADDADAIAEMAGLPPAHVVDELWTSLNQSDFAVLQNAVDNVVAAGFSAQLLVNALLDKVLLDEENDCCMLNELSQAEIAIRIAEAEKNMIEGADEYLQLMTVATLVMTCYQNSQKEEQQQQQQQEDADAMVTN